MNNIKIVPTNLEHQLPDFSDVFAKELRNILMKLQYQKGDDFEITMDTGYAMVYYALNMNIEYQKQGGGAVPENIVDDIWDQVVKASKQVFEVCKHDFVVDEISKIFYNKIKESRIVPETLFFWERYQL